MTQFVLFVSDTNDVDEDYGSFPPPPANLTGAVGMALISATQEEDLIAKIEKRIEVRNRNVSVAIAVTTETEHVQQLRKQGKLMHSPDFDAELQGMAAPLIIATGDTPVMAPQSCPEKSMDDVFGTQHYMTSMTKLLQSTPLNTFKGNADPNNIAIEIVHLQSTLYDTHNSNALPGRSPDGVGRVVGLSGPFAITFICDVKPSLSMDTSPFTDAQVGHILEMTEYLLSSVQPWRFKCYSFLTDTRRFQFFKTIKQSDSNSFSHQLSCIFSAEKGWQIVLGWLKAHPSSLGYESIQIEHVECLDLLGIGKTKYVFGCKFKDKSDCVLKLFENDEDYETELKNLKNLSRGLASIGEQFNGMVPAILQDNLQTPSNSPKRGFVLWPQCNPVQPCANGQRVYGEDIAGLVSLLEVIHTQLHIVHRDIKPQNMFKRQNDGKIFLNDWGSAVSIQSGALVNWEGTTLFYNRPDQHVPSPTDDLIALARASYLMIYNDMYSGDIYNKQEIQVFWENTFRRTEIWSHILQESRACNYPLLKVLYAKLK